MAELEKRYDTDYQGIINQLNDEFQKGQNSMQSTENAFVDIFPDNNRILENLPKSELIKIRRKLQSNVEEIDLLTQDEKDLLRWIKTLWSRYCEENRRGGLHCWKKSMTRSADYSVCGHLTKMLKFLSKKRPRSQVNCIK